MSELTSNQQRALVALLEQPTVLKAAEQAGLHVRTLHVYLGQDAFKAALRERQSEVINAATAALSELAGQALDTLASVMRDTDASDGVRVRAALGILEQTQRLTTFADIQERITILESQL